MHTPSHLLRGLFAVLACLSITTLQAEPPSAPTDALAPGSIRFAWNHGSISAATNKDPRIQIIAYNEDTYILRENLAVHWEGSFTYLLFGQDRALLIDTGATANAAFYPLRSTVDTLIKRWCAIRGKTDLPLTVVLTSGEDVGQNQGYTQFVGRPATTLAPLDLPGMKTFFGFSDGWPSASASIDLGGRSVTVIPSPGTHKDGLSFYDPYNGFLHTGDLLMPGRILIANDADYLASITRLKEQTSQHPLKWIMGGHIEMTFLPGVAYLSRSNYKPREHVLQMESRVIDEALAAATHLLGQSGAVVRPDFVIQNRVGAGFHHYPLPADIVAMPPLPRLR
jgi:glyoxylase-like metal-dependent hydrolase (beta-lactamase superfamily II)